MEAVSNAKLADAGRREHLDEAGEERWVKNRSSRTVVRKSVPWAVGLSLFQSVRPSNAGKQSLGWKRVFMDLLGLLVMENLSRWVALSMAWRRCSTREFLVIGTIPPPSHALDSP